MAFDVTYTASERWLHRVAFAASAVQLTAADVEASMYGKSYRDANAERPVFVTSLARAGTTMMLEILHQLPELASHTYRDMPFVLAPVLWSRWSSRHHATTELRERAHGDGVEIGYDSPEAFEEVFWKTFWPKHYLADRILPWSPDDAKAEATEFFREHMKKVVTLRRPDTKSTARYLSKNNANIHRLPLLRRMFPDASILVVLRDPAEHAHSLMRQHQRFTEMQAEDPFVARYMEDIGHFEFGALHRPFDFPELASLTEGLTTDDPDYWLAYWVAAFTDVEQKLGDAIVVDYEDVCARGRAALAPVCAQIGLDTGDALESATAHVREARPRADRAAFEPALLERAEALHRRLRPI